MIHGPLFRGPAGASISAIIQHCSWSQPRWSTSSRTCMFRCTGTTNCHPNLRRKTKEAPISVRWSVPSFLLSARPTKCTLVTTFFPVQPSAGPSLNWASNVLHCPHFMNLPRGSACQPPGPAQYTNRSGAQFFSLPRDRENQERARARLPPSRFKTRNETENFPASRAFKALPLPY